MYCMFVCLQICTIFPFLAGNCGKQKLSYNEVASCDYNFGKTQKYRKEVNLFPSKVISFEVKSLPIFEIIRDSSQIPTNLNNCSINISTTVYAPFVIASQIDTNKFQDGNIVDIKDGIEIKILEMIVHQANFYPQYR